MSSRHTTVRLCLLLILSSAVLSVACTTAKNNENRTTTTASPASTSSPVKDTSSATPASGEVDEAVRRVYVNTVKLDTSRIILGDFNGDGSQDLVIVVRPVEGSLAKLNSEYANWTIEDPRKIRLPDPNKAVQQLPEPPVREMIHQNDTLLLILHGYGGEGWRHSYARQTFLLKNSVGDNMRAESWDEISKKAGRVNGAGGQAGDVISLKLDGQEGFLYWTSGKYVWHQ